MRAVIGRDQPSALCQKNYHNGGVDQFKGGGSNLCVSRDGVPATPHGQPNPILSPCCPFSGPEVAESPEWG